MQKTIRLGRVANALTLSDRVYAEIKQAILDLRLMPGTPLVEDELARELGTSKTPIRDALVELERDGLVTKIPYKGTYVTEVSVNDATELFEIRAVLEGLGARLAAQKLQPHELDDAEALLDAAEAALARGDPDAASAYGASFHRLVLRQADNKHLAPMLAKLEEQLRRLRRLSDQVKGRLQASGQEHRAILVALRSGDSERAEQAMRSHLESVVRDFERLETPAESLPSPNEESPS